MLGGFAPGPRLFVITAKRERGPHGRRDHIEDRGAVTLWLVLMLAAITLPVWLPLLAAIAVGLKQCWPLIAAIWILWWTCG